MTTRRQQFQPPRTEPARREDPSERVGSVAETLTDETELPFLGFLAGIQPAADGRPGVVRQALLMDQLYPAPARRR